MKLFLPKIFILVLTGFSLSMYAQEYRSIDGYGNNVNNPEYGAAGSELPAFGTSAFADGISAPAGPDRPNPRYISNQIFMQNSMANDIRGLSAYAWAWGQFIDHDITMSPNHPTEQLDILVPAYDTYFDPTGTGNAIIPMHRSDYVQGSGTSVDNPRRYINGITAFIDASAVYGSDLERADWLRTFSDGKLKTSSGDLLPYNTTNGEYNGAVDPNAPEMDMPMPFVQKWFVAGDFRANENPFLTAMHTTFVREHNRLCTELKSANPGWTDEQLYQKARKLVGGLMQAIVFEEWLPALGIHMSGYAGYDEQVNPGILNAFNTAAYRYGHTTINNILVRMDNQGNYVPEGNISLKDAYFNPNAIVEVNGIEPYLIGMATVVEQDFDCKVIDDLRNFLFGQPGSGGLDLVALNINRGRDRGLPDYNTVRSDFGLSTIQSFNELTSDPLMNQALARTYGNDLSKLDPWVGMLSEDHMDDALFGETAMTIIERQFQSIRDGDRFYFEIDSGLSNEEINWIKQNRLSDVIKRNTGITIIQDEIFIAQPFLSSVNNEISEAVAFEVFPNPTDGRLYIQYPVQKNQDVLIRITDPNGKTLLREERNFSDGNTTQDVLIPASLPGGIYFISLWDGSQIQTQRILKN